MDEQISRERAAGRQREEEAEATGSSQDREAGQAGAKPDPQGHTNPQQDAEGKPAANAAESGPDAAESGAGTGARAGEYS
ncbi:MAG TPA: hypothetical protein VF546_13560 [Pyrinomonadaceae bacterium]|jgi:hypothetical protein